MKASLARYLEHEAIATAAQTRHAEHIAREERAAEEARLQQTALTARLTGNDASRRAALEAAIARAGKRRERRQDSE